jgi:hypothetical protein
MSDQVLGELIRREVENGNWAKDKLGDLKVIRNNLRSELRLPLETS